MIGFTWIVPIYQGRSLDFFKGGVGGGGSPRATLGKSHFHLRGVEIRDRDSQDEKDKICCL